MNKSKNVEIMRYPSDEEEWSYFDATFPEFAKELRNIRLELTSDGIDHLEL